MNKNKFQSKNSLLIVDNNIHINNILKILLEKSFHIIQAYNGIEGFDLAKKHLPDIIIAEIKIPNINGIQMCEKIKSQSTTAHIPLIIISADTNENTKLQSLTHGANIFLNKPFKLKILKHYVHNLINITAAKRKLYSIEKSNNQLSSLNGKFIQKLEDIINQNIQNPNLSVEYITKEIGMSAPIIYKKLKAVTNLSVNNFVKLCRFKKSIELLKSETNITEIAYQVGFSDRKYFSKEFKKHFGVNPTKYYER